MFKVEAELYAKSLCELGEGPIWDDLRGRLIWLDIKRNLILSTNGVIADMAQNVGCAALRENGGMIMGLTAGVYLADGSGDVCRLDGIVPSPKVRFNDGKCDPMGRFWAGTMNLREGETGGGELFCILPDRRVKRMLNGVTISNGLAFSGDMKTLYYIDTPTRRVDAFDILEGADGFPTLTNRRVAIEVDAEYGSPDGMTIDRDGNLWVARWGSGTVGCYNPKNAKQLGLVKVPLRAASSCCFGADDMQTLFITTAREGMAPGEEPFAGNVYAARLNVVGTPSYRFKG